MLLFLLLFVLLAVVSLAGWSADSRGRPDVAPHNFPLLPDRTDSPR